MRIIRRASLVLSLTLIIAIAVGFIARRAEAAHTRDAGLRTAAEVGASQMSSIIDTIEIAAAAGADPRGVAEALVAVHPQLGVCAVDATEVRCAGTDLRPPDDTVEQHRTMRREGGELHSGTTVTSYETMITVTVDGPDVSVVAVLAFDAIGDRNQVSVWARTFLPKGTESGEFAVASGVRQIATTVSSAPNVYVVAATDDGVTLPAEEMRFYMLTFALAIVLLMLAGATLIVEHRTLVERASFDPLTKLPNRSEFERCAAEVITTAERQSSGFCLLLFDLNGFKQVNDTYGHAAGDEMLKVVGSRLRKAVRDDDIVARWGGDEFVVVMPGITDDEMGARRAEQLADQVSGRTRLDGVNDALRVKVSVGVAVWPRHGIELERLVEAADQAMYQAKREGVTYRLADVVVPDESTVDA